MRRRKRSIITGKTVRKQKSLLKRKKLANESAEKRKLRRLTASESATKRRARETEEQSVSRRLAVHKNTKRRINGETEKQTAYRLALVSKCAQRRREKAQRCTEKMMYYNAGRCGSSENISVIEHNCGSMTRICQKCNGLFFSGEKNARGVYSHCCHFGKILEHPIAYPGEMRSLMDGSDNFSRHFKENIRSYNSALSFASMGAQVKPPEGNGPYCFRIHGQIYHRTGHLHPHKPGNEKFSQLYVLDSNLALRQRMEKSENASCNPELMKMLDEIIRKINPYANAYKMLHEMEQEIIQQDGLSSAEHVRMYITEEQLQANQHRGRFNVPKQNEIAMIFSNSDGVPPTNRDICIYPRAAHLCQISTLNPNCEPMTYVLFYPHGERGFKTGNIFSELQFYSHRLTIRKGIFNPIFYGGKLMQQYVVDAYVKVEGNRLRFIKNNQETLRVECYLGLADHINALASEVGAKPGKPVILPSTFIGSPRAMHQNFQDAMAVVRDFGKPDIFLTFTCNPKWTEITENLFPGQKAHDRPDLISRVFDIKKKALLEDLKKHGVLGHTIADIHVIEFQKRGFPHMHLLLFLAEEDKIRNSETIDRMVCAEIPDETLNKHLHDIVSRTMLHGPCGAFNPHSPCMKGGSCSKGYPKQFRNETAENIDGYPMYRRRDNGRCIRIKDFDADNRWVVPYNPYLTQKYNAHINIEICSSVKSIKYIFKYVYKGHDCAKVVFENNGQESVTWDEIKTFLNARYISAPEAMWRLLEKPMHQKSHTIFRLPVHLPNMQPIYFHESEEWEAFERARSKNTMLTAWFELNRIDPDANTYTYADIPKHFVWKNNVWQRRIRSGQKIISRMYSVSPKDIERYCLRLLLCHVPGAKSFVDLCMHDNIQHDTFKKACISRNLLEDDGEWLNCLRDACVFQMPAKLRQLFSFICVFCNPTAPLQLWEEFKIDLSEDFLRQFATEESYNFALNSISHHLKAHNMSLSQLGLPKPSNSQHTLNFNVHNVDFEKQEGQRLMDMLNPEQRVIFDTVLHAIQKSDVSSRNTFCVNAFAGSGKSFLFNAIIHAVRGMNYTVVSVAWTGISAVLLEGGKTVHSRFKLPVPILENSSCNIRHYSEEGRFLKNAKLILWDECTMTPNHALNAVDRLLRDLMGEDRPFGGKVIILGGDWRQILPVADHANRTAIIEKCLKNSPIWMHFHQFTLAKNMRTGPAEQQFSEWLLRLGDGKLKNEEGLEDDLIEIPAECLVKDSIVNEIFGSSEIQLKNLSDKAILCPKNEHSLQLNEQILKKCPGDMKTYFSADSIISDNDEEQENFQLDFINTLTPSGMPPHQLNLKIGVIVMLLRNLNPTEGLCNGTRLVIKRLMPNVIDAEIMTGHTKGSRVFIPRILLTPSDTNLPFKLQRRQFPLRLSFAMTINKAQGQTFQKVGIYLPQPIFSHGMLYVAFSRSTSLSKVKVCIKNGSKQGKLLPNSDKVFTPNVVFREVL